MKGLFKSKPKTPTELLRVVHEYLTYVSSDAWNSKDPAKKEEKMTELNKHIRDLKCVLYGNGVSEPSPDACAQLTEEFFKENTMRLLVLCIPKLNLEARKDATQIVANLQRQQVNYRLVASDYLEENKDLIDHMASGYEDIDMALHYGTMLRECIRHQCVARYILESEHTKKFFDYIQLPNFDIASDASATFKELFTRHKSTVAEFLTKNYDWFFAEFSKLLESSNYITRRQAVKLLGEILWDRNNNTVMVQYVSSIDNLRILMNLLKEPNKNIQLEAFQVFKLFVGNKHKPPDIVTVFVANREKILRFFNNFTLDKEDEQFKAEKAEVIEGISSLEPRDMDE